MSMRLNMPSRSKPLVTILCALVLLYFVTQFPALGSPFRDWGIFGILLGIATTRPVMGIFFATSRVTHLLPQQFFGIAFWIGFSIDTLIVELWLRSAEGQSQIKKMAVGSSL